MKNVLMIFLLSTIIVSGQIKTNNDFKVQSFSLDDKLDEKSKIDPSYGKYADYEFDINSNDHFVITVSSNDFTPYLFISSPKGKNIFAYPGKNSHTAELDTVANESGKWSLYVVCDTLEQGNYTLSISFSDKKSYSFPTSNDFNTVLRYLVAHANANFAFIKKRTTFEANNTYNSPIKFPQAVNSKLTVDKKSIYSILFFEGTDKKILEDTYSQIKKKVKEALPDGWMTKEFSKSQTYEKYTKFSSIDQPTLFLKYYNEENQPNKIILEIETKR